jgi:hypothetical protein
MSDFGDLPRIQGRVPVAHSTGGGQPSAELIAHLVIALSRYRRQLRTDGVWIPAQVEDLITFLAHRIRRLRCQWSTLGAPHPIPRPCLDDYSSPKATPPSCSVFLCAPSSG